MVHCSMEEVRGLSSLLSLVPASMCAHRQQLGDIGQQAWRRRFAGGTACRRMCERPPSGWNGSFAEDALRTGTGCCKGREEDAQALAGNGRSLRCCVEVCVQQPCQHLRTACRLRSMSAPA